MKRKKTRELVLKASEGLLSTVTNLLLFQFFLLGSSLGKGKTSRGAYRAINEASRSLEDFNYQTLKRAAAYLKRKGLLRTLKEPQITAAGIKRLKNSIPVYQKKRPWDGSVYLVTYDIPENERSVRNQLRELLKKIGAGYLQASVWITPYNPEKILQEFHQEKNKRGEIIVSCIGKDGYIGEQSLKKLVGKVYNLEKINDRYRDFLARFDKKGNIKGIHKRETAVDYLCILRDDPQLPWELLPEDWQGDKAYELYQKIIDQKI